MEEDHQRVPGPTVGSLKWSSFGPKKWPCTETRIFTWFKVYVFKRTAYHMKTQCCYFTVLYHQNMKKDDINRRLLVYPQNHKNVLFDNTHMEPSVVWRENVKWPILDTLKKGSKRGWKQGPQGCQMDHPKRVQKRVQKRVKKLMPYGRLLNTFDFSCIHFAQNGFCENGKIRHVLWKHEKRDENHDFRTPFWRSISSHRDILPKAHGDHTTCYPKAT